MLIICVVLAIIVVLLYGGAIAFTWFYAFVEDPPAAAWPVAKALGKEPTIIDGVPRFEVKRSNSGSKQ